MNVFGEVLFVNTMTFTGPKCTIIFTNIYMGIPHILVIPAINSLLHLLTTSAQKIIERNLSEQGMVWNEQWTKIFYGRQLLLAQASLAGLRPLLSCSHVLDNPGLPNQAARGLLENEVKRPF